MDSYRTFVAIQLPRAVRAKLIEHTRQLRRDVTDARASWTREDNLHLTVKFLGDVSVNEIPKLSEAVARAVAGMKPFELTVAGCGVFPPRGKPSVLWIGVHAGSADILHAGAVHLPRTSLSENRLTPSPLDVFYQRIEDECADAGFAREPRPFHPHLTIARLRKTGGERHLAEAHQHLRFMPQIFSVSEVVVFKSELRREGSKHTAISRHPLRA